MASTRDTIIETTSRLLELQGYFATGLNQIVAESGAPKGSLYYYFPDGKEGLTAEVIERTGQITAARISEQLAATADPVEAIYGFVRAMVGYVQASDCRGGGPITTVALETSGNSERLRVACNAAYQLWRAAFAHKLATGGFAEARAQRLAYMIIAAIEGAIVLCRAEQSVLPLEHVAEEIQLLLTATRGKV